VSLSCLWLEWPVAAAVEGIHQQQILSIVGDHMAKAALYGMVKKPGKKKPKGGKKK
jgi:hypothetical protein